MRRHWLAGIALFLARLQCTRNIIIRRICELEGGQVWSGTFRDLIKTYYQVEIGAHSYGECLSPGRLPRGTRVGNYCSLAAGIQIFRRNHPVERPSQHAMFYNPSLGCVAEDMIDSDESNPLVIGHDVWIGQNVIITPGCKKIGIGAVVAAGAVVTRDVPDFCIVAGVPAKMVRWRFSSELQASLKASAWWLRPFDELRVVMPLFLERLTLDTVVELAGNK